MILTLGITNGMFSDYFVVGCKTPKGFSTILVPKSEQVDVKLIKTSYSTAAATTYIEFNNARAPRNHLLGEENKGMVVILSNFNHVSPIHSPHLPVFDPLTP